jgi:hypothetical protein
MFWTLSAVAMVAAVTMTCVAPASAADKENVIYSFKGGNDEGFPYSGLIFDPAGNLYGTNCGGGSADYYGTAFKLTPTEVGSWKLED